MLELRTYTKSELSAIFGTRENEGLKRKMLRYGIVFDVKGNGEQATYTITQLQDPFKVFCIIELGIDGRADFHKLRDFYYYFFNDEEFMAMPDEVKEYRMFEAGHPISRQTIAGYIRKLEAKNYICRNTTDFIYYFANKQNQRITDKAEYLQAWHEYWAEISRGICSFDAICNMRENYGGVARKQAIPEINGIYNTDIEFMLDLISQSMIDETER